MEYCTPAWSLYYVKDKELLERVQHRFTRMVPGMRSLAYEERLEELRIWALEERRNRADLIEVFKILKGFTSIDPKGLFEINTDTRTRGHTLKLVKHRFSSDLRKYFFTERVVSKWNKLDQACIDAPSVNSFKKRLTERRRSETEYFYD